VSWQVRGAVERFEMEMLHNMGVGVDEGIQVCVEYWNGESESDMAMKVGYQKAAPWVLLSCQHRRV